jgi:hypothetical protein
MKAVKVVCFLETATIFFGEILRFIAKKVLKLQQSSNNPLYRSGNRGLTSASEIRANRGILSMRTQLMLQSGCIRQVQPNNRMDASLVLQVRQISPGPHKVLRNPTTKEAVSVCGRIGVSARLRRIPGLSHRPRTRPRPYRRLLMDRRTDVEQRCQRLQPSRDLLMEIL